MSSQFITFTNEFEFFTKYFLSDQTYFIFDNYNFFFYLTNYTEYSFLNINSNTSLYTKSIISFINQTENIELSNNIENVATLYHYSIPNVKLAYPEPFIASPSFMHSDLWFIHILVYQYWLWFVFVFIIVFFFITFICTIRWCNMRIRPRRETRGVSRSKCGDLITACVPVTWATSIIVNESTDAIDYYDGFGTTELVVGIRAYQWGWEYYYPKDIDLNYNIKPNYSIFVGNSLKYEQTGHLNLSSNNLWKFYQNKTHDQIVTPAHLLIIPSDNYKLLNFFNFQDVGFPLTSEANAFQKVKMFSKTNNLNLVYSLNNFSIKYKNFSNLFINDNLFTDSYLYGLKRQHNFLSTKSLFNNQNTFFNLTSVNKIINFNFNFLNIFSSKINESSDLNFFNKFNVSFNQNLNKVNKNPLFANSVKNFIKLSSSNSDLNLEFFFNKINVAHSNFSKNISMLKTPYVYSSAPIKSNNVTVAIKNISQSAKINDEVPAIVKDKKEPDLSLVSNLFFNFSSSNTNFDWRLYYNQNYNLTHSTHYLPLFSFYYDYDFRNWQSIELLEDSFWESVYSVYTHDEYVNVSNDFYNYFYEDKYTKFFHELNRLTKYNNKILEEPLFASNQSSGEFYSNTLYVDDFISNSNLISTKDFYIFPIFNATLSMEDSYESSKYLNYYYNSNNSLSLNNLTNSLIHYSSFFVFDSFRDDYDEFSWFFDSNNLNFFRNYNLLNFSKMINIDNNFNNFDYFFFLNNNNLSDIKTNRFSNSINLRAPAKASIVTYNAIQKVFKTRFDENRSNTKLSDFGYFYNKQAFISSPRVSYEKLLGKNKENFYMTNLYKNNFNNFLNTNTSLFTGLNYYFFDFPFLLAFKSDSSRYLWFDWFAKWGMVDVQPSSSSRYAIYGMPYLSKKFDFNGSDSDLLNETETYLLRISRSRRNYLPNWVYTPYFYAKHSIWYKNNLFYEIFNNYNNSLIGTYFLLNSMDWYSKQQNFFNYNSYQYTPSNSGVNSFTKLGWKPQNSIQSYYYNVSNLIDILTKREFLYRELFSSNKKFINLPIYLTTSPNNPLISEVKASFLFTDPVASVNEYSREIHYNSLKFFNFIILQNFLNNINNSLNLSFLTDYIFYYFFDSLSNNKNVNNELYKSQYRPLKKGITNMIRLHGTGAIAMPIEIRLQILASSRDVIHSWAIPSAGIKIDCVPGYSSHKVMIFLVSGIFWGQCMEICGRYHHWMPIIVYFMKRDLFFLWCTHFVFLTGSNNIWNINDRQYTDYVKVTSIDKNSWIHELNN